jgi:nucleotidyltransferase/DNA polymerase involved in DNA repair
LLGFQRIGDLLAQPRAPLTLRFGPELGRRLDQALGQGERADRSGRPAELIEVRRAFAEPIGAAETIARHVGLLAVKLCEALAAKGLGARRVDLVCHRVDSHAQAMRVGTATPVRDPKRLTRLLTDRIETIDPGFGIEVLALAATLAEPLQQRQTATMFREDAAPDVSDLVDTLGNRIGERRLYRVEPVASDVPERSTRRVAPLAPTDGATWPGRWPRPSRLLPAPEPIEAIALLPDHPPAAFTWRGVRRRVRRGDGPERVFGEWWRRDAELAVVRDYFRVEDEAGERFWIFRAGDGEDEAPARSAGSCTGCSDERPAPPRGAPGHLALLLPARRVLLRGAVRPGRGAGIEALGVVDRNSLAGIVRAHEAAKATGVRLVVGCRLDLACGASLLVYPTDRSAYGRLCRLLSLGKKRGGKARCVLDWPDLVAYGEGLVAVLVPDEADDLCGLRLRRLRAAFGDRAYMALTLRRRPNDQLRLHELATLAKRMRVPTVVTNDVLFHEPGRRVLQDVVTAIRHGVTVDELGDRRERHADRHLKPPEEMARLFPRDPDALARTLEIAERCRFSLDELAYQYPRSAATLL